MLGSMLIRPTLAKMPKMLSACLLMVLACGTARAADEPAAGLPDKKDGPDEGQFEIAITTDDETRTYDTPSKASSSLRRAVSQQRRAREGEVSDFTAIITLNGAGYQFTDAIDAQSACQAVTMATRQLAQIRMGLGDIGPIPKLDPEATAEKLQEGMKPTPAQAMMIVRQRIMVAMAQESRPSIGTSGLPSIPNPLQIQQKMNEISQREIKKAQDEGLLPSGPAAVQGDPIANQKEAIIQMLAFAFSKADPVDATPEPEQPEAEAKDE